MRHTTRQFHPAVPPPVRAWTALGLAVALAASLTGCTGAAPTPPAGQREPVAQRPAEVHVPATVPVPAPAAPGGTPTTSWTQAQAPTPPQTPAPTPTPTPPQTPTAAPAPTTSWAPRSPTPDLRWAVAVRVENARRGTGAWSLPPRRAARPGLDGYADAVSVRPGTPVRLHLRGKGRVRVTALRTGWYDGAGARAVWTGRMTATAQPRRIVDDAPIAGAGGLRNAHTVVAGWRSSGVVPTSGWPEGHYVLRLDDGRGASRQIPLTVRSATARGRVLLVTSTMTWQAYNHWGGHSLYLGPREPGGDRVATRSLAVSYDRPYDKGAGAGDYPTIDAPLIRQAERAGVPLAWATDVDLADNPELMDGATAVVVGGHAEYWTARTVAHLDRLMDDGTNLAVFGANTMYWRARVTGRRVVVTKDARLDPLSASDPAGTTVRFAARPAPQPEQRLLGVRTECTSTRAAWVVSDPSWFGYDGTGLVAGSELGDIVGGEIDAVPPGPPAAGTRVVARGPVDCGGRPTAHTAVWLTRPSGAGVFAAGTIDWVCALQNACKAVAVRPRQVEQLGRVTRTVLTLMAEGPAAGR